MNFIEPPEDVLEILDIIQGGTYEEKIKMLAIEKGVKKFGKSDICIYRGYHQRG